MGLFGRKKHSDDDVPTPAARGIVPETADAPERGVRLIENGGVEWNVQSVAEAKLAIKQIRVFKRETNVQKKVINAELAAIRANRRAQIAQQGSKMRGGGRFGQGVRALQTLNRDADRRKHVDALAPYEDQKRLLDIRLANCDLAIAKLEQYILDEGG